MAPPSLQYLPRWLPPPPYLYYAQGMRTSTWNWGSTGPDPGVYCPSTPGCLAKISLLASSNEGWQKRGPWKAGSEHHGEVRLEVPLAP